MEKFDDCKSLAGSSRSRAVLRQPLDCWDRGFEFRWWHGYSSFVFVQCITYCDELITPTGESYLVCVCLLIVCDLATSKMSRPRPDSCCNATDKQSLSVSTTQYITVTCYLTCVQVSLATNDLQLINEYQEDKWCKNLNND
jgi:hypothetical protein